jgi:hypothetical protein
MRVAPQGVSILMGRQFEIFPSQPPNWIATPPSAFFFAVMLLTE